MINETIEKSPILGIPCKRVIVNGRIRYIYLRGNCKVCNKDIWVERKIAKYCSNSCQMKDADNIKVLSNKKIGHTPWNKGLNGITTAWNKGKKYIQITGSKNPMWKGGITPRQQKIRTSFEYKQWRKAVMERDDYTCMICGNVGGKLNVHHIKSFSENPLLRFDINNGITLCVDCHYDRFHPNTFHKSSLKVNNNIYTI